MATKHIEKNPICVRLPQRYASVFFSRPHSMHADDKARRFPVKRAPRVDGPSAKIQTQRIVNERGTDETRHEGWTQTTRSPFFYSFFSKEKRKFRTMCDFWIGLPEGAVVVNTKRRKKNMGTGWNDLTASRFRSVNPASSSRQKKKKEPLTLEIWMF